MPHNTTHMRFTPLATTLHMAGKVTASPQSPPFCFHLPPFHHFVFICHHTPFCLCPRCHWAHYTYQPPSAGDIWPLLQKANQPKVEWVWPCQIWILLSHMAALLLTNYARSAGLCSYYRMPTLNNNPNPNSHHHTLPCHVTPQHSCISRHTTTPYSGISHHTSTLFHVRSLHHTQAFHITPSHHTLACHVTQPHSGMSHNTTTPHWIMWHHTNTLWHFMSHHHTVGHTTTLCHVTLHQHSLACHITWPLTGMSHDTSTLWHITSRRHTLPDVTCQV